MGIDVGGAAGGPGARVPEWGSRSSWLMALAVLASCRGQPGGDVSLGRALFAGERPLRARIVGHSVDLPQIAVRCPNCHRREAPARVPAAADATSQDFAPSLARERLTGAMHRRGGPASRYDRTAFCRLVREGIDPAVVMIPQTMPRYRFTEQECAALWTFLTSATTLTCCLHDARC